MAEAGYPFPRYSIEHPKRQAHAQKACADRKHELLNFITHGIGLLLSLAGAPALIVLAVVHATGWHVAGVTVYGMCLVLLYSCSTLYHGVRGPRLKSALRLADHSAIFLLIAGTYTPFTLVNLRGPWGWFMLAAVWLLAICGIAGKLLLRERFASASTVLYLLTGWLAVIAIKPMLHAIPAGGLLWLLAGGILYTGGLVFFAWERCPYNHAVWHLFVVAGSACHYFAVLGYVLPLRT